MNPSAQSGTFVVWLLTVSGLFLGLAAGLAVGQLTGDFVLPPITGAAFGGAASTAFGD